MNKSTKAMNSEVRAASEEALLKEFGQQQTSADIGIDSIEDLIDDYIGLCQYSQDQAIQAARNTLQFDQ
tara:strand:+ start:161 stop:367 length:207 start_codon:yes stop_codon:yes gene_type:complete